MKEYEIMLVSVIPIGNSRGIRIPKNIITELKIEDKVEMEVQDNEIVIRRSGKRPRQGWDESFSKMHELSEDKLLIPDTLENNSFKWE
jgi:antitoxin MazE